MLLKDAIILWFSRSVILLLHLEWNMALSVSILIDYKIINSKYVMRPLP